MYKIATALLVFCSVVSAQFTDDFSQGGANTNWIKNPEALEMVFKDDACSITNNDDQSTAYAFYSLTNPPSTFTLSGTVKLSGTDASAGFVCCLASSGLATGYYVSILRNEMITVNKVGASGKGVPIVSQRSAYITSGANKLTIRKKESSFNITCNNHFVANFTDDEFASGNIAMQVSPKTTAVFDDISFTETFIVVPPPTCFTDDFGDGDLLGWDSFGDAGVVVENSDNAMRITTQVDQTTYRVIDLPLDTFVLRASFSHRTGSTASLYGLFLCGEAGGTVPISGFGITGAKSFAVYNTGSDDKITLTSTSTVKGAAYIESTDTVWYVDTLEVLHREGEEEYLFVVNGDTLSRYTNVPFQVTGAGVFCMDNVTVSADDFLVAQGDSAKCLGITAANNVRSAQLRYAPLQAITGDFDLLGRLSRKKRSGDIRGRSSGVVLRRTTAGKMLTIELE